MIEDNQVDVIVVGAGPAGIGISVVLKKLGLNFIILEKDEIGSSFKKWPKETKFISPSFSGNYFKMTDLNAITPDTSPALTLLTEHPTGMDYVVYLERVAMFHDLPIYNGVHVKSVKKEKDAFVLATSLGVYRSIYLIWAAGEFQYPRKNTFSGTEHCLHYAEISSFSELEGEERIVIGAYESGFDAAVNLINVGKDVTLMDSSYYMELVKSDSSYCLSPFTRDRVHQLKRGFEYLAATRVDSVSEEAGEYIVATTAGDTFSTSEKPINCTGFSSSLTLVSDLFQFKKGYPLLNELDESVETKNMFLVGPQVKHKDALFCFIYKYRQRFAIVAEAIAKRSKVRRRIIKEALHDYKEYNFYLDDLSCCDDECVC